MVEMVPVVSSNIEAAGHDAEANELWVRFKSGGLYAYAGMPAEVYEDFIASASAGAYLSRNIKPAYPARRIEEDE